MLKRPTLSAADVLEDSRRLLAEAHADVDTWKARHDEQHARVSTAEQDAIDLAADLAHVVAELVEEREQALPHLHTRTWPQAEPVRAVICDELVADTEGFQGYWE